jgi:ABC-2 type transport system ATP-binding protein
MTPIIQVDHLVKRYNRSEANAVDDISFSIEPGEFFALLGPNGAGKTTTISILTTTLTPTSGTATICGYDLIKDSSAVRQKVGIIFQRPSLDNNLTAEENVRFHATLYGLYPFRPAFWMMPHEYQEKVRHLAGILGIENDIFKPIKTYSGGMKRKLEIVRSLIHNPKVLFLDEPTTGLDPASRRNLWEYLTKVRIESGTTILLTTHYLEEAEQADTICIINKGKVVSYGTPDQMKANLSKDSHVLIDAENKDQLRRELETLPYNFTETPQFKITLNGHSAHQIIKSINTPLSMIKVNMPTLEDVYLSIVEQPDAGI